MNLISTDFQEKFRREFAVRLPCLRSANDEQHPPRRHTEAISETENCRRNRAPPRIQQTPQAVATEVHQSSNKTHVRLLDLILNRKPELYSKVSQIDYLFPRVLNTHIFFVSIVEFSKLKLDYFLHEKTIRWSGGG